jgi:hypothetical protein
MTAEESEANNEKLRVKQRDWRANRTPEKIAADKEKNKRKLL